MFCQGEPAWSALNTRNKFLPGKFLCFSKLAVHCVCATSREVNDFSEGGTHLLKEAIVESPGFYYAAIITLSSFELAS